MHPASVASLAAPIPGWELGAGGVPGAAREGQGWVLSGAGVKGPGWVVGGEEGAGAMLPPWHGWESPGSQLCRRGAGKQSSFSSSLLPASPVPAPKGEGRKEGEHPSWQGSRPGARAQTYSRSWERASLRSWEGKTNRKPLLTHPNTALLARGRVEHGLCKGFKPQFPGPGCQEAGARVGSRREPRRRMGTSIAAKQNPPARSEGAAQSSSKLPPCPPLPWGTLSRGGDGGR